MTYSERLNTIIKERGITKAWLSKKIGVREETLWRWTKCGITPTLKHRQSLAELFEDQSFLEK